MPKSSFVISYDFREIFDSLTAVQKVQLMDAIFAYEIDGIYKKMDGLMEVVFIPIKQYLDKNKNKYESKCMKNKENANIRWHANASERIFKNANDADSELELELDSDIKKENIKRKKPVIPKPELLVNGKPLTFWFSKVPLMFNNILARDGTIPKIVELTKPRKSTIVNRTKDTFKTLEGWRLYFEWIRQSKFWSEECLGRGFDMYLAPKKITKIKEGTAQGGSFYDFVKQQEKNDAL